tara:strand:- start:29 stop:1549 length:1521 start_codon:yes stop_codon:yes gene_type:complete
MNYVRSISLIGSLIACSLVYAGMVYAQNKPKFVLPNVGKNGEITGFSPKQGKMVQQKIAGTASGSPCGSYLRRRGWKEGFNNIGLPSEFAVAIGIASTEVKMGDPGFIDSRYVAFREAWMDANTKMAGALEKKIRSEASSRLKPGKNPLFDQKSAADQARDLRKQASQIKDPEAEKNTVSNTLNKGLRWLNAMMDDDLKKSGHDIDAEKRARVEKNQAKRKALLQKARAAEEEAEKLLRSRRFREVIESAAKERMKGIYTQFVSENIPTDSPKAQFCVTLRYTKKSERLADAMAARDFSNVPMLKPGSPIVTQLPDPSNPQGVFQLVNKWGLSIKVDENGQVNLVAFGQAEVQGNDSNAAIGAKTSARLSAENLLRLYINQTVALQEASKTAEDVNSLKNGVTKVQVSSQARKEMEQGAGFKKINGIREVLDWQGVHPATSQGIYGVVVAWNAAEAAGAIASKQRQNKQVQDTGGVNSMQGGAAMPRNRAPVRRGGLSGTTESKDF